MKVHMLIMTNDEMKVLRKAVKFSNDTAPGHLRREACDKHMKGMRQARRVLNRAQHIDLDISYET